MFKGFVVGIDFGIIYFCVGVFQYGKVEIIVNDQGNCIILSYVVFMDIERLIGDVVKNQVVMNFINIVFDVKCLIGCRFDDVVVQFDMKYWFFMVVNDVGRFKV